MPRTSAPTAPVTQPRATASLVHGTEAWGARYVRPGFAVDGDHDLAFALGFPHLEYLLDDHPDDAEPEVHAGARKYYDGGWPREVAARWCRLTASGGFRTTPDWKVILAPKGQKALAKPGPITADEARALLVSVFRKNEYRSDLRLLVRLLEAFVGPEAVGEGIVQALAKAPEDVRGALDDDRAHVVFHAGFSLLRSRPPAAETLRGALEEILSREAEKLGGGVDRRAPLLVRTLDLVLHGRAAAERSAMRVAGQLELQDVVHVTDDPGYVMAAVRAADPRSLSFDSRLAFLAGQEILDWWLAGFDKHYQAHHAVMARHFGPIRSPQVAAMLSVIAKGKSAKAEAQAWLARQGG